MGEYGRKLKTSNPRKQNRVCVWVEERAAAEAEDKVETGVAGAVERIKLC